MKLCEKCGKRAATVHYRENVNGIEREWHLCAHCAEGEPAFELTGGIFTGLYPSYPAEKRLREEAVCPRCKTSLSAVRRGGTFGCALCYDTFSPLLDMTPFVGKGYGGKRLSELSSESEREGTTEKISTEELRRRLAEAVAAERYEEAAALRDRIREEEK